MDIPSFFHLKMASSLQFWFLLLVHAVLHCVEAISFPTSLPLSLMFSEV